jgi:3-carboxy-cis,cis-muconate cycloisomerase
MSELFWPGDERAGAVFTDAALIEAMTRVESAWLKVLRDTGLCADVDARALVAPETLDGVEAGGNPVIRLVQALRDAAPEPTRAWLHRGLTSQDVLDTALMLCLRAAIEQIERTGQAQVATLRDIALRHRASVQAGRTLTQHAVPTTFGLTAARWLDGVVNALTDLRAVPLPVQLGGAAGTLAAVVALTGGPDSALRMAAALAAELDLEPAPPWHTVRRPITRAGDALVSCVDVWGLIAHDVLLRSRPEIGELSEAVPGGS